MPVCLRSCKAATQQQKGYQTHSKPAQGLLRNVQACTSQGGNAFAPSGCAINE
jgi:hypothetical protein